MAIDLKYGRVTFDKPNSIAEDEPVVVFRARDALLPDLLWEYLEKCRTSEVPSKHIRLVKKSIQAVASWQAEHGKRWPRSDNYEEPQSPGSGHKPEGKPPLPSWNKDQES